MAQTSIGVKKEIILEMEELLEGINKELKPMTLNKGTLVEALIKYMRDKKRVDDFLVYGLNVVKK